MIPDEDDVLEIDVSSLDALADQLHTLTGLPDRHRDLADPRGTEIHWPRLQWAGGVRTRDNEVASHAFEVVQALDKVCTRLRDASRQVGKDFADADRYTAKELEKLADALANPEPEVR